MGNHTPPETATGKAPAPPIVIDLEEAERQDVGYTSRIFVQALFPYRKTDDLVRQVQNGPDRITVTSPDGLPYGKYPRLIMAYIITQAVHRQDRPEDEARRIPLGSSMNSFLGQIGLLTRGTGGQRGSLTLIREQLCRITTSSIKVEKIFRTAHRDRGRGKSIDITDEYDLWFDPKNADQATVTESYIELTREFYQQIIESPIPIDLDVLKQLNKPRAIDLYVWLALKKFWLSKRPDRDFTFTWDTLALHFSPKKLHTWVERRDFRTEIKKCLATIQEFWPEVGADVTPAGLLVHQGDPPVKQKSPRRQIGL